MVVRGSACEAASCTSRSGTPASSAAVTCVPQGMGADLLVDSGAAGDATDNSCGTVPVEAFPGGEEQRAFGTLADGQVDGAGGARGERYGDDLAALAGDDQGPVATLEAQVLDVGAGGIGDSEPVEREQGDQGVLGGRPEPSGDQERADLVAVQGGGVRLVVAAGERALRASDRGVLPQRRTCRTRRWCTSAG